MKLIVNPHKIELVQEEAVNEKEINVSECEFQFADEITNNFVKEAYFTLGDNTYKKIIVNNKCSFPQEVLVTPATIELGVVAYYVEDEEELIRYNPTPVYFKTDIGSLKEAENSQEPTPSEMEQYEQALQDGLTNLDNALDDLQDKVDSGYFDGKDGIDGVDGVTPTIGDNGNWYLGNEDTGKPSRGEQGAPGDAGAPGPAGRDGAIQYTAGNNITIENNVISADVPSIDLSDYLAKDNTTAFTPTGDYNPATKKYADEQAEKTYPMLISGSPTGESSQGITNYADIGQYVTNEYVKGKNYINFRATWSSPSVTYMCFSNGDLQEKPAWISGLIGLTDWSIVKIFNIAGSWNGNVYTVNSASVFYVCRLDKLAPTSTVLQTTNTTPYTPTGDYHPATKKYVDDAIADAITDALGGDY